MPKVSKNLELLLPIFVAILIGTTGMIRIYYANSNSVNPIHTICVALFFSVPMIFIGLAMFKYIVKDSISPGYLTSAGIIAACSVRNLSEILIGWSEINSFIDIVSYLIPGIGFLFLSYVLLRKGRRIR